MNKLDDITGNRAHEPQTIGESGGSSHHKLDYTCAMCAEVHQSKPGPCPKCGMVLEPRVAMREEESNPELIDMTRRFWVGLVLSMPVLILSMSDMIPGQPLHRSFATVHSPWVNAEHSCGAMVWMALF